MSVSSSFSFNPYPFRYSAKYTQREHDSKGYWEEEFTELPNEGIKEKNLSEQEKIALMQKRSIAGNFPLVNYSTQYALSCFEGLKAFPQTNGNLALFRPEKNAKRFYNSMQALYMPPFDTQKFVESTKKIIALSRDKGFYPQYNSEWKGNRFSAAKAVYIRPFTYPEAGLGLNISKFPWVIMYATEVGNYLDLQTCPSLMVSDRTRSMPRGTGWVKCNSNYVISIIAKQEAIDKGFTETLFLDHSKQYVEECSSCNVFFVLKDNTIVSPELSDTILPGITRESVIDIAQDLGFRVLEQKVEIAEIMKNAKECFATGTAIGIEHFGVLHYNGVDITFGNGEIGEVTSILQSTLKKIQYGLLEDTYGWLVTV